MVGNNSYRSVEVIFMRPTEGIASVSGMRWAQGSNNSVGGIIVPKGRETYVLGWVGNNRKGADKTNKFANTLSGGWSIYF